jgi:hypothetical protein
MPPPPPSLHENYANDANADARVRDDMGGGVGCCSKIKGVFVTQKKQKMVTNLKAMSFGSSGLRPVLPPNRLLTSLGVLFGGVVLDIV